MKKISKYLLPVLAVMIIAACTEDKGNYDYNEVVEIFISPIGGEDVYEQLTEINITPKISFSDPNVSYDDFEYVWYIFRSDGTTTAGNVSTIDTLSRERNLSAVLGSSPNTYRLNLKVIDKKTGVYSLESRMIEIINGEAVGYALLSDIDGDAELAFVSYGGNIKRNVFENVNGRKAGKNPTALHFPRSTSLSLKCLWILCDDDNGGSVVSNIDFSEFSTVRKMCVFPPESFKDLRLHCEGYAPFEIMIAGGVVYNRSSNTVSYPLIPFGAQAPAGFKLSPFLITNITGTGIFYDNENKRFRKVNTLQTLQFVEWADFSPAATFDPKNVGMEMIEGYMCGPVSPASLKTLGRSVMKGSGGKVHLMNFTCDYSGGITPGQVHDVSSHTGMSAATLFTIKGEGDFMYYVYDGHKIGVSSFLTGSSLYEFDSLIPYDLTIDCIKTERFIGLGELWVAASDGSGGANSGSFFIFTMASDGKLTKKAEYRNCCGKVIDILYKN